MHFVCLANTLLKHRISARNNHVLACNFAKYSPISKIFSIRLINKSFLFWLLTTPPHLKCVATLRGGFRHVQHVRPNGGPHKKGSPTKGQKKSVFCNIVTSCCNSSMHCSPGPQQNVDDDYCACRPWQCRVKAVGGGVRGIHILGPTFFLNWGLAWSKSGPGYTTL